MVVRRRDLHHIRADQLHTDQRPHKLQRFPARQPPDLRRAGSGGERRVHAVDIKRHVDGTAAKRENLFFHPGQTFMGHLLRCNSPHPVLPAKVEIGLRVHRPADSNLHHPARIQQLLLNRPPERRAVEVLVAEVLLPHVLVRVDVHHPDRPVLRGDRPQDRQRQRVIPADAHRDHVRGEDVSHGALHPAVGILNVHRVDVYVAHIRHTHDLERADFQRRVVGADQAAVLADVAGTEPGTRPVRRPAVKRDSQQRDVELRIIPRLRQPHERRRLRKPRRAEGIGGVEI